MPKPRYTSLLLMKKVCLISMPYSMPKLIFNISLYGYSLIPLYPFGHIKELMKSYSLNALNSTYFLCKYFYIITVSYTHLTLPTNSRV